MNFIDLGQEFSVDPTPLFIPSCISQNEILAGKMKEILTAPHILPHARMAQNAGTRFFLTTQSRGRAYWHTRSQNRRVVTIPEWVFGGNRLSNQPRYAEYYICHELAHIRNYLNGLMNESHGPKFMAALKHICPPEIIHYELEYKPRNAQSAGIYNLSMDSNGLIDF